MQTEVFGGLEQGRRLAVLPAEHGAYEGGLLGVHGDGSGWRRYLVTPLV
ncbi:hypothetical protein [Streptomyces sp. NPDC002209]